MSQRSDVGPQADGTVYSRREGYRPFSAPPLESYLPIVGEERLERLRKAAERLNGRKLLEINATAQGGGVAEMLYSSIPFLDSLGLDTEWKTITGTPDYYEVTKLLHNLLQGKEGALTPDMVDTYVRTIEECAGGGMVDNDPDVVMVHDPQPLGLASYLREDDTTWLWRCHIDVEEEALRANRQLWDFAARWIEHYDAGVFTAIQHVVSQWPITKFTIPPFIDPLSDKNRDLDREVIDKVLVKYGIDSSIPIIAQVGRFDPWKGLDRTIATYRQVRKEARCQLVLAGGIAGDDPEGERVLASVYEQTKDDEGVHVLRLSLDDRRENYLEVNALQRAANVLMQPSTREGFGLVVTEGLWKGRPVVGADVGGIPLQIRDGESGYMFRTVRETAETVIHLLGNPSAAELIGARGKRYVQDHFLLPDRLTDYLTAIDMLTGAGPKGGPTVEAIVSFHPWIDLKKRT